MPTSRSLLLLSAASLLFTSSGCMAPPTGPPPSGGGTGAAPPVSGIQISPEARGRIARKIWQNECGGTVEGLVSWNAGEGFASLGIGHFIWFPAGGKFPYEESFPGLQQFLAARGVRLPNWLATGADCPWPNRAAFQAEQNGPRVRELRAMLAATVDLQGEYLVRRLEQALPRLLQAAPPERRALLSARFHAVGESPQGIYALVDYVNFKGEGVNPKERYRGQGWGLLQVLENMQGTPRGAAGATEFGASARRTLAQRVANAPKDESRWTAGWNNRVAGYGSPLR